MKAATGFTIIELMIVVAIGGILMALALPSYDNMVRNNCRTTATNSLVTGLQFARSEAVKRRTRVNVTAADASIAGNEWIYGWDVWTDKNGDGDMDLDADPDVNELLREMPLTCEQPAAGANRMTIAEAGGATTFTYVATGFIDTPGTFTVCNDNQTAERGRQITISNTGRPSTNSDFVCP